MNWLRTSAVLALTGCGGGAGEPGGDPAALGWVADVALHPEQFTTLVDGTSRDGWIALHGHRYAEAAGAFGGDEPAVRRSRARAEWSLALLYGDLHGVYTLALDRYETRAKERQLALSEGQQAWAALGHRCAAEPAPGALEGAQGFGFFGGRLDLHARALAGEPGPLAAAARRPIVVEAASGFDRQLYDPCLLGTLAAAWEARARASVADPVTDWAGAGLEGRLLAPWLVPADLSAPLAHAGLAALPRLGVDLTREGDDLEAARAHVRALDARLDADERALLAQVGDEGRALLVDLRLVDRVRQEQLVVAARSALAGAAPRVALTYLEMALDVSERGVGPANAPALYALLTQAQLRLGHTREALDALQLLADAHPEVAPLQELVGDVAVLEGLDRHGDSKEN